ncbi:hypothetical protein [uncultured Paracoccus sp.]|uniref:hypothetical protein n=1 Tax=uncultured Paracoccus sp. TaxID=189685 RepID=UPI0025CE9375|nr:hypothetical protein [uncultured Paracoccus sp.]
MTEKMEINPNDQIVLTREPGNAVKFKVHLTGPGRGISGNAMFSGTFEEAVQHIKDRYQVE